MRPVLLAALLAAPAAAVTASTSTAPTDEVAGHGFKVGGGAPAAKLRRPLHAVIHKDAVDWEPLSLREGGVPGAGDNSVSLKVVKVKGLMKGGKSKAKAFARLHKGAKGSLWLAISVHPQALERKRTHFELRFRMVEGFIEEVEAAAVTVTDRRSAPSLPRDSYDLREEGVEYQEERPGSGQFVVAEFDPRPSASAANSGRLEKAGFADKDLGFVNLSWSLRGLRALAK